MCVGCVWNVQSLIRSGEVRCRDAGIYQTVVPVAEVRYFGKHSIYGVRKVYVLDCDPTGEAQRLVGSMDRWCETYWKAWEAAT